jgi:nickel/cobalt exporter
MMRRVLAVLALLATWSVPSVASAHPLGNFTVNHYARLEAASDHLRVVYVLDLSEIPTFQDRPRFEPDPEGYADQRAEQLRQNLHLEVNGSAVPLRLEQRALTFREGSGGLQTLRLEATYSASVPPGDSVDVTFRDDNDPSRIGWREIVARPGLASVRVQRSDVPAADVTNELRQYPEDLLNSPLNVRTAHFSVIAAPGTRPSDSTSAASAPSAAALERARGAFADLANAGELTPAFIVFALGVALVLGAAHALQPGHGKTIVAAYLVGARGTARHAMVLGATVTATHTAGVYALGLVTLFLSQYIVPERLYPILEAASGVLVIGIGALLLIRRLLAALRRRADHQHTHGHDHAHRDQHAHAHGHAHAEAHGPSHAHERVSWRSLLALGVSGGLLPCPEALMVLLITIAAHRVLFGLALIVAFSTGLAAVLVGFGLLLVYARGLFARLNLSSGLAPRLLPVASALVIVLAGGVITAQALPQVL